MIEMNPYYAHESSVGPVFDVATWLPRKAITFSILSVLLGGLICVAIAYIWDPSLFLDDPPELIASLNNEIAELHKEIERARSECVPRAS